MTTENLNREIPVLAPRAGSAAGLLRRHRPSVPIPVPKATQSDTRAMTTTIPIDILDRAKSAYRHYGPSEGVRSFSEWVTRALERELLRWESEHNDGARFVPERDPLTPGRKVA